MRVVNLLPYLVFVRPCSELNRNRIRQVEGLTFQGLSSLEALKLQRNSIGKLTDGAFWDLAKMKVLYVSVGRLKKPSLLIHVDAFLPSAIEPAKAHVG